MLVQVFVDMSARFTLINLPVGVSVERRSEIERCLAALKLYAQEADVELEYVGGITNHGFRDRQRNLFIRVPGLNSHLLVDRAEELHTLQQLKEQNFYTPTIIEAYCTGDLKGYKVERFLAGETLQFDNFHLHQSNALSVLKSFHDHAQIALNCTFNIFDKLIVMQGILIDLGVTQLPFLTQDGIENMPMETITAYITELQETCDTLFPYLGTPEFLSSCHNDITPYNFMKFAQTYCMIDFEYAAKNDKMYDLAILAAMCGLDPNAQAALVLQYFNDDTENYSEEIRRVQFYTPLVKLYYGIWATLQVHMGNESNERLQLIEGWGPASLTEFIKQFESDHYQDLILSGQRAHLKCV